MFEHRHRQNKRRDRRGRVILLPDRTIGPERSDPSPSKPSRHWPLRAVVVILITLSTVSCALL